ncbi:MAG: hypothetical protein ACU836_16330 [Gammaproteobacteria bacterium]
MIVLKSSASASVTASLANAVFRSGRGGIGMLGASWRGLARNIIDRSLAAAT